VMSPERADPMGFRLLVRLAPGVTPERAIAELQPQFQLAEAERAREMKDQEYKAR